MKSMTKIRRSITRFERLAQTHCGYEESVAKAVDSRFDLEDLIQGELQVRDEAIAFWKKKAEQKTNLLEEYQKAKTEMPSYVSRPVVMAGRPDFRGEPTPERLAQ